MTNVQSERTLPWLDVPGPCQLVLIRVT